MAGLPQSMTRVDGPDSPLLLSRLMSVTRETLYTEVWAEPMTTVAARYKVSSSFLARVCERLGVPRPPRGYWAQLEVGKAPPQPSLPLLEPGQEIDWSKDGVRRRRTRTLPQPPPTSTKRYRRFGPRPERHPLVAGVKELYEQTWPVGDSGYLRPRKKRLPDIFCSPSTLSRAIDVASELYLTLEDAGHRVNLAPTDQYYRRPDVDHREVVPKRVDYYSLATWSPARPTVVLIGTVAIGLTLYELSQRTEVHSIDGKYVAVSAAPVLRGRQKPYWSTWTTHHDLPTGRLVLRAYSPYGRAEWSQQWCESKVGDLSLRLKRVVMEVEAAAPIISDLVAEGERQAEIDRQRWEVEQRERARQEAERARLQALKDSREQLLAIIDKWALARQIETFLEDASRSAKALPEYEATALLVRLDRARELLGGIDPLRHFDAWQSPEDRGPQTDDEDE